MGKVDAPEITISRELMYDRRLPKICCWYECQPYSISSVNAVCQVNAMSINAMSVNAMGVKIISVYAMSVNATLIFCSTAGHFIP